MSHATFEAMCALINKLLPLIERRLPAGETWRGGGWFYALNPVGECMGHIRLGAPPPENDEPARTLSQEKAERLRGHPDHYTSHQSRDEATDQYGGAIRGTYGHVLAFSGLPEAWDEALMRYVMVKFGLLTQSDPAWKVITPDVLGFCIQLNTLDSPLS